MHGLTLALCIIGKIVLIKTRVYRGVRSEDRLPFLEDKAVRCQIIIKTSFEVK